MLCSQADTCHMHVAAHVCVLASRTSNCKRQPIPLSLLLLFLLFLSYFFGLWQYVCVCPGLGARLHSLSARCEGYRLFWVLSLFQSFLKPILDNADLPHNNYKASHAEKHSNRIVIIAKPAAS